MSNDKVARNRRWLLHALFVQPLAGPVARKAAGWLLDSQICASLQGRNKTVRRDGMGESGLQLQGPGVKDWWHALAEEVARGSYGQPEDEDGEGEVADEDDETAPLVETHTRATVQGIVHTSVT